MVFISRDDNVAKTFFSIFPSFLAVLRSYFLLLRERFLGGDRVVNNLLKDSHVSF